MKDNNQKEATRAPKKKKEKGKDTWGPICLCSSSNSYPAPI